MSAPKNTITYRYRPGAIGDGSTLDNGAIMVVAYRRKTTRDKRLAELQADGRVQWATADQR